MCRLGDGRLAVVFNYRQNTGTLDQPDYTSLFYVHTKDGILDPHTREAIRELWADVTGWTPTGREQDHLDQAESGKKSWVQAMSDIESLYHAEVPATVGEGTS
jgi:hypothetical protein